MKEITQKIIALTVNGRAYEIPVGDGRTDMPESETLAHTLRDRLELTGLKIGCDQGACGCCTVIMDGRAVTSCMTLTMDCDGADITTIEGLADRATGELDGLQQAFLDNCGYQCGFCIPGVIMTARRCSMRTRSPRRRKCGRLWPAITAAAAPITRRWNPSWPMWIRTGRRGRSRYERIEICWKRDKTPVGPADRDGKGDVHGGF